MHLAYSTLRDNAASSATALTMRAEAKKRREYWVAELEKLSGSFGDDYVKLLDEHKTTRWLLTRKLFV